MIRPVAKNNSLCPCTVRSSNKLDVNFLWSGHDPFQKKMYLVHGIFLGGRSKSRQSFDQKLIQQQPVKVLAIASSGGHWQQLMALQNAFEDCDILFGTTLEGLPEESGASPAVIIPECNRSNAWRIPWTAAVLLTILLRFRPDTVISTGALPGLVALALAKILRKKTIWVDSLANAEKMSMSGRLAKRFSDLWLSQWLHVAEAEGAEYKGAIL